MAPKLTKISDVIWELPVSFKHTMRIPVRFIATEKLIDAMDDAVFEQAVNVASLPGLVSSVFVMPDSHSGYGAPIGCVFASDGDLGVISPGAVGYDINCGMRLITTNLTVKDVQPRIRSLVNELFVNIPVGVGGRGFLPITKKELPQLLIKGAQWVIDRGFGWEEDKASMEEKGAIPGADPESVSDHALERGLTQLATLGSGNHYLEIQRVGEIFDTSIASTMRITSKDQVTVMIHSGSRGLGHQVATDYLRIFAGVMERYHLSVPDKQLSCAPIASPEGKRYLGAMTAAANFAFANRQALMHQVRAVFTKVFGKSAEDLGMHLVYDVTHNIAKFEEHYVSEAPTVANFSRNAVSKQRESGGTNFSESAVEKQNDAHVIVQSHGQIVPSRLAKRTLVVHRKGATRAFPGQPVIIGGSMETGSYLLVGTERALSETFGSTAHGSGRTMSRHQAKREVRGEKLQHDLASRGIYIKSASYAGLAEEAGVAYKDIQEVVKSVFLAGISDPVASFIPLGNIKG